MATITTEDTYLCTWTNSGSTYTYTKLCDITEFPDLGSSPASIDCTTLSDHQKKSKKGLIDPGTLEFSAYYDKTVFNTLDAMTGAQNLALVFGTISGNTVTPSDGGKRFTGEVTPIIKGGGVEAMVGMGVSVNVDSQMVTIA